MTACAFSPRIHIYLVRIFNISCIEQSKNFDIFFYGDDEMDSYNRLQYLKMFLIHCYIKPYYSDSDSTNEDFLKKLSDTIESKLEESESENSSSLFVDQTQTMVHWFGLIFSLEAMKVYRIEKPDLLEKALLHM